MIVYAVEFTSLVRQSVDAHNFVDIAALNPAPGTVRHARNSALTAVNTAIVQRNVVNLAIDVLRSVTGGAGITSAQNHVANFVIALVATNHVEGSFHADIPVLVSVENHVQKSAESVTKPKSQRSFSAMKTSQTHDSWNWQSVVTSLK